MPRKWDIGREIVEEKQHGKERAEYGKALLKSLAEKLTHKYHRGFSVDTLEKARKFHIIFQEHTISETPSRKSHPFEVIPNLSWSHYVEL